MKLFNMEPTHTTLTYKGINYTLCKNDYTGMAFPEEGEITYLWVYSNYDQNFQIERVITYELSSFFIGESCIIEQKEAIEFIAKQICANRAKQKKFIESELYVKDLVSGQSLLISSPRKINYNESEASFYIDFTATTTCRIANDRILTNYFDHTFKTEVKDYYKYDSDNNVYNHSNSVFDTIDYYIERKIEELENEQK